MALGLDEVAATSVSEWTLSPATETDGTIDILRVVRGLALGLTESAFNALKQWKFSPGKKNERDVDTIVNIEVNFSVRK